MAASDRRPGAELATAAAVFAFLASVYLLTFGGRFGSIDEFAIYALAESLVQTGRFATPQLEFAKIHNPVGRVEPGQAFLAAPFYALARNLPGVNTIHAVMLVNVFTTALTGAGLFLLARGLGFGRTGALSAALAFGLGTMAWPYARTFLREPAVGLAWVGALGLFLAWEKSGRPSLALAWVLCLLSAAVVKVTAAAALPAFLGGALLVGLKPKSRGARWVLIAGLAVLAGAGAVAAWRFGPEGLLKILPEYSPTTLLARTYGQLFSPAKGLAFFSPIVLLVAPGWVGVWQRSRAVAAAALGTALATLVAYGGYDAWYGGLAWGPRFTVPLLPLLSLPAAALADRPGWSGKVLVGGALALSLPVQLAVVAGAWDRAVLQFDWATDPDLPWYDLSLWYRSPAVYQLLNWSPAQVDFIWWHHLADGSVVQDAVLGLVLSLGVVVAAGLMVLSRPGRRPALVAGVALGLPAALTAGLLSRSAALTRDFPGLPLAEARQLAERVGSAGQPFTLVTVSNEFFTYYWLGLVKGRFVHHWYSPYQRTGFEAVLESSSDSRAIWLVVDRAHIPPTEPARDLEFWLNLTAYRFTAGWVGSYEVFGYLPPADRLGRQQVNYRWQNGIELTGFGIETNRARPGAAFRLEFDFRAGGPVDTDYDWFVHLLGPDGRTVLGRHAPPGFGARPTSTWSPGTTVTDQCAIRIPADIPPGEYRLVAGFFRAGVGPVPAAGHDPPDYVVLGTVTVSP